MDPSDNQQRRYYGGPIMTTNAKLKLISLLTTIVLFALPVADALASRSWS